MPLTIPADWTFKTRDVASSFDQHVREQLPWYELATGMTAHIARHYIPEGGLVYDIGASTGNVGKSIADTLEARKATFIPIDNAESMLSQYAGPGELKIADAAEFCYQPFDLAICFLSLMFIPTRKRRALIKRLKENTNEGGCLLIVDKTLPAKGYTATVMTRLALAGKVANGTPAADIIAKELSLAGTQRPLDYEEIAPAVEVFRFGDFAAWILEK